MSLWLAVALAWQLNLSEVNSNLQFRQVHSEPLPALFRQIWFDPDLGAKRKQGENQGWFSSTSIGSTPFAFAALFNGKNSNQGGVRIWLGQDRVLRAPIPFARAEKPAVD